MRAALAIVLLAACTPATDPAPDAGNEPAPSCDRTMEWKAREFSGAVVHVIADGADGDGTAAKPYAGLQRAIDAAPDGATLKLAPGTYVATASAYTDPTCGNCLPENPKTPAATTGFTITRKALAIVGAGADSTVLHTNAGYGVFVEDACEVQLEALTITGGKRDPDGDASDGAVFVRRSRAVLRDVTIRDNKELLPENRYPGITGVMAREDSDVLILGSTISGNSWDGVSVYRGGRVRMYGSTVRDGKGVAVGATWDGRALLVNNVIASHWKGIGAFVDAHVVAYNNVVHDNVGWGVWAAGRGHIEAVNNTIAYNDCLGVYLAEGDTGGVFRNNIVAFNGLYRKRAYPADTFGRAGVRGLVLSENPFAVTHNVIVENQQMDWVLPDGKTELASSEWGDTNYTMSPGFVSETDLHLKPDSSLVDRGDPALRDADGTLSDPGAYGGPEAGRSGP